MIGHISDPYVLDKLRYVRLVPRLNPLTGCSLTSPQQEESFLWREMWLFHSVEVSVRTVRTIGRGATSTVYAIELQLPDNVGTFTFAAKVLHKDSIDDEQFHTHLHCAGIVCILPLGYPRRKVYLMEIMDGSLQKKIPMGIKTAYSIVRLVRSIITERLPTIKRMYLDCKAANILFKTKDGRLHLALGDLGSMGNPATDSVDVNKPLPTLVTTFEPPFAVVETTARGNVEPNSENVRFILLTLLLELIGSGSELDDCMFWKTPMKTRHLIIPRMWGVFEEYVTKRSVEMLDRGTVNVIVDWVRSELAHMHALVRTQGARIGQRLTQLPTFRLTDSTQSDLTSPHGEYLFCDSDVDF